MRTAHSAFDLALSYPQWQGSGRADNLPRGAEAAASVCGRYGPLVRIASAGDGEARGGINRWTAILTQFRSAQTLLTDRQPQRILTAGGDCAVDIAVIDYLHRRHPELEVLWVDAHMDANTAYTTPSGNFHGMPVAAIMGAAPEQMRELLGPPLPPAQFRYVSTHVGDEGDWQFQRENQLRWWEPGQHIAGPVHIHFDLDALDPAEFPHVAYPDGRLSLNAGLELVRSAAESGGLVGLTITEFAPVDQAAADAGSRFLERLCETAQSYWR
jgi:arginase